MKLFEYMAMKIPVVASRWGDIPTIVEDGRTGLLHAPGDPAALSDAIREAWRDREGAMRRAEQAHRDVQQHTWRAIARRVLDWSGQPANFAGQAPRHAAPEPERKGI
jgi:glycosyltransferase involved in cell wall biosynthesis